MHVRSRELRKTNMRHQASSDSSRSVFSKGHSRPDTFAPVAAVYCFITPSGIPKGHEPHLHPTTLEICFVARGNLEWWVADQPHELHSGDVILMYPGEPHGSLDSTLDVCELWALHLDPEQLSPECRHLVSTHGYGSLHRSAESLGRRIQAVFQEHEHRDTFSASACQAIVSLLLTEAARTASSSPGVRASDFVRNAIDLLTDRAFTQAPIQSVAEELGVSTVWLNKRFRAEVGMTPGDWVRGLRTKEARRLLAIEGLSVTETSIRLGYATTQYFATSFRRAVGISPSAYRSQTADEKGRGRLRSVAIAPI